MSSSSNETEELVRSFPPPPPRNYWFRPQLPPPSYQPPESSSSSPSQPALSPPRVVSSGSEAGSIYVRSTSNYTYHQLDGHNSSAEQKARRKRARKEREPVIEVYFRHYCARCGRTRSKSYHRAHPVEPGKEPYPEICSICIPPEGPVSEVSSRKPREIEEVTEELLIRRGCGNRVSGLLKPRYVDVIRVKRRSESPDRTPVRRRKSDSSERIITVRTQSSYERLREPAKKSGAFDSRGFRVRVRSSSHNRSDREKDEKPAPQRSTVYDDDSCYDTRGRAIGHVRLVTVIHPRPREPGEPREPAEPQQPKRPKRSPSPPEWYFRRVRRVSASMPRKEEGKPEIFVDRTGYFDPEPSRRPQRNLEGPDWGPTARGALCQQEDDSPPDKHNPVRGVLQHFRNEKLNRPNDLYGAEAQRHRRRYVRGDSSGENEAVQERRVRFAPETRSNGKEAQRRKKYQEEVKDWQEEQRDKSEYKHAKKQVRKGVNEGGGKYELYDVDGHYSEEMGASGKRFKAHKRQQKGQYTDGDEREEGFLSWFELFGGMDS